MNSYRRNDDARSARRGLLSATVLVALLFLLNLVSGGALGHVARAAASSIWQAGDAVIEHLGGGGIFASRGQLEGEDAALQKEVTQLQGQVAAASAIEAQNQQLTALVHLSQTSTGITAPVISSFSASPYGTFEIGAGTSDGVQTGALVMTPDGFVVGHISDVSVHQSLVVEFFAPGTSLNVLVDNTPVTLQGEGGGNAQGEAPHGATIAVGDPVEAPSLGEMPVGVVGNVEGGQTAASTQIDVRLPANIASLQYVYVETSR